MTGDMSLDIGLVTFVVLFVAGWARLIWVTRKAWG